MGRKVSLRCSVRLQGRLLRPFSDSLKTKFAQSIIQELGRSLFDGAPPAETRAHRSDGQCQRIRLRQPLHPATTCSTPMPRRRRFGIESTAYVLLTKPSTRTSWECRFYRFCRKNEEPTSGLEPLTCSLRVIHQALQGFAGGCKCRIFRGVSFPCLAACCTVLRSRWYQSGIRSPRITRLRFLNSRSDPYRCALAHPSLHAAVSARLFPWSVSCSLSPPNKI